MKPKGLSTMIETADQLSTAIMTGLDEFARMGGVDEKHRHSVQNWIENIIPAFAEAIVEIDDETPRFVVIVKSGLKPHSALVVKGPIHGADKLGIVRGENDQEYVERYKRAIAIREGEFVSEIQAGDMITVCDDGTLRKARLSDTVVGHAMGAPTQHEDGRLVLDVKLVNHVGPARVNGVDLDVELGGRRISAYLSESEYHPAPSVDLDEDSLDEVERLLNDD
jgi:hypothetical protein